MKVLKVFALLLIFCLLYLGLGAILLGIDARVALLEPGFYTSTLDKLQVYEAIQDALADEIAQKVGELPASEVERVEAAARTALDPEWLAAEVEVILENV